MKIGKKLYVKFRHHPGDGAGAVPGELVGGAARACDQGGGAASLDWPRPPTPSVSR